MSRRAEFVAANPQPSGARMALNYLIFFLFTLYALYPMGIVVASVLRPTNRDLSPSLAQFRTLVFDPMFVHWLGNSMLVAVAVSITGVALASFAGYAFSRRPFRSRSATLDSFVLPQLLPAAALLFLFCLILSKLNLINAYPGLTIIYVVTALPFCIWQLKGYYDTISLSLEEAAGIDGCTRWQTFYLVVLPLAVPALVITALFSFLTAWNEYVVAALIFQDARIFTLPLGLKMFQANMSTQWGLYTAGALLIAVPVVSLFLLLSRFLARGLKPLSS